MTHKILIFLFLPAICLMTLFIAFRLYQFHRLTVLTSSQEITNQVQQIPLLADDPISGSPKAGKTIIAFEDFGCESCATQNEILKNLIVAHPKQVKVIWKTLSVNSIPYATKQAHTYAYCAHKQGKFELFKDYSFENRLNLSPETLVAITEKLELDEDEMSGCVSSADAATYLDQNEQIARTLQVQAVPAVFVDNTQIPTPTSVKAWELVLGL